jgi:D-sedoheptulose 7-phosphate isomerase
MDPIVQFVQDKFLESARLKEVVSQQQSRAILITSQIMIDCFKSGGKMLICGNGGSAADSQHFAAELIGRLKIDRHALPAIALTTDTSILTSIANDYSFDKIFQKQVEGLACKGDVFIGISTSGTSQNVIQALISAKEKELTTIALAGKDGGHLSQLADYAIIIPSFDAGRVQECHITIIHIWCELIERALFSSDMKQISDARC